MPPHQPFSQRGGNKKYMSKKCRECSVELTKENSFYPNPKSPLCKKHYNYSAKAIENRKKYAESAKGKLARTKASKEAYIKHKEKWIARAKLRYAVSKGLIKKLKRCEVCEEVKPLQGHHEDYSLPLEVVWLCTRCHADRHLELELLSKTPSLNN